MIQKQVKGKPFNCDMAPDKKFVYETQAIQREQHRSKIYKEVQAN